MDKTGRHLSRTAYTRAFFVPDEQPQSSPHPAFFENERVRRNMERAANANADKTISATMMYWIYAIIRTLRASRPEM